MPGSLVPNLSRLGPVASPEAWIQPAVFQRINRAQTLLWTLPGIPLLYYGDEIGMPGGNDPDSRRPMLWTPPLLDVAITHAEPNGAQLALRTWIEALAAARAAHPALRRGQRTTLMVDADLYVYARFTADDAALVVLNRGGQREARVDLGGLANRFPALVAAVGAIGARLEGNTAVLDVPAGGAGVLTAP